jgi:hemolysin III
LKIFDHSAIYLLIAGTYTPFLLVNLRGGWGWSLLGIVWGCAMAGIIPYCHVVWHLLVMAGSGCHYLAVVYAVVLSTKV